MKKRDRLKNAGIALALVAVAFLLVSWVNLTGSVAHQSRPAVSCGEKIDERFPSLIELSPSDPVTKQKCNQGKGIEIERNFVTLDCKGNTISSSAGRWAGIHIESRAEVTIKNCVVEGFGQGIGIFYSDKNTITDNYLSGVDAGLWIKGRSKDNLITKNVFREGSLGVEWDEVTEQGNLLYGNDFYTETSVQAASKFKPIVCQGTVGNYLSSNTFDGAYLQGKSSCGKSERPHVS